MSTTLAILSDNQFGDTIMFEQEVMAMIQFCGAEELGPTIADPAFLKTASYPF